MKDPDGKEWLRKEPLLPPPDKPQHTARRTEPAIELLALELAKRVGIETSIARPATWNDRRGVVSQRFHQRDEDHHPGGELLSLALESGSSPEAKRRRDEGRASATVERVRTKLEDLEQAHGVPLLAPLSRIEKCGSGFGGGLSDGRTGLPMREVLLLLAAWPEWPEAISELAPHVRNVLSDVPGILDEIPDDWLPAPRKRFAAQVLERRVKLFDGA